MNVMYATIPFCDRLLGAEQSLREIRAALDYLSLQSGGEIAERVDTDARRQVASCLGVEEERLVQECTLGETRLKSSRTQILAAQALCAERLHSLEGDLLKIRAVVKGNDLNAAFRGLLELESQLPVLARSVGTTVSTVRDRINSSRALERSCADAVVADLFHEIREGLGLEQSRAETFFCAPLVHSFDDGSAPSIATWSAPQLRQPLDILPVSAGAVSWPWSLINVLAPATTRLCVEFGLEQDAGLHLRALGGTGTVSPTLAVVVVQQSREILSAILSTSIGGPAYVSAALERLLVPGALVLQPTAAAPLSPYATLLIMTATLRQNGFVNEARDVEQVVTNLFGPLVFARRFDGSGGVYSELAGCADSIVGWLLHRTLALHGSRRFDEILPFFSLASHRESYVVAEEILTRAELTVLAREVAVRRAAGEGESSNPEQQQRVAVSKSRRGRPAHAHASSTVESFDLVALLAGCRVAYEVISRSGAVAPLLVKASREVLSSGLERFFGSAAGARLQRVPSLDELQRMRLQRSIPTGYSASLAAGVQPRVTLDGNNGGILV